MRTLTLHHWLRLLFWGVFTAIFLQRIQSPGLADDVDFLVPLKKWVTDGPQRAGFWHTPFYPWILSLLGRFPGQWMDGLTPALARIPGYLCVMAAVVFQMKAFDRVTQNVNLKTREAWKTLLCFVLLFSPITIASALILDYDNTLLQLGTAAWFYRLTVYSQTQPQKSFRSFLLLSGALCLCFVGKETTPFAYPLALWVLSGSFSFSFFVGAFGFFLFLGITWIWCQVYQLPLSATFDMAILGLQKSKAIESVHTLESVGRTLWAKTSPVLWLGFPLVALILTQVKQFKKNIVLSVFSVILITVLVYTFVLKQMTYHYPKYMSPVFFWLPWVAVLLSSLGSLPSVRSKSTQVFLGALFFWTVFGPNPLDVIYLRDFKGVFLWIGYFAAPLLFWSAQRYVFNKSDLSFTAFLWIVHIAFCMTAIRVSFTQRGSIAYWYGDQAIQEIHVWLEKSPLARLPEVRLIAPAKDVAAAFSDRMEFLPIDRIAPSSEALCHEKRPFVILTRKREDTSLLTLNDFEKIKNCVTIENAGRDFVIGYRLPKP